MRSAQGVEAWLVETPELPVIALHFAFRDAGVGGRPTRAPGTCRLRRAVCSQREQESSMPVPNEERLSELGAALTFTAEPRYAWWNVPEAVRDSRDQTFELLRLALTRAALRCRCGGAPAQARAWPSWRAMPRPDLRGASRLVAGRLPEPSLWARPRRHRGRYRRDHCG